MQCEQLLSFQISLSKNTIPRVTSYSSLPKTKEDSKDVGL